MRINLISESVFFPKGHGVHTAFLNVASLLKSRHNKVLINSFAPADVVHIHTVGLLGLFKLLTSKTTVVSAHIIPDSLKGSLVGEKYWGKLASQYLTFFYNKADHMIAVAPKVEEQLRAINVTTPVDIIPNAIDTTRFTLNKEHKTKTRKEFGIDEHAFVAIASGQVQTRKGVSDFIEAARSTPEITFVWAGGTPFQMANEQDETLKKELESLPSNMHFIGTVSYEKMPNVYNMADVFFFPSYQENAPMSVIEAGASSLPLLLRDLPEYKKLYKDNYIAASNQKEFLIYLDKLKGNTSFRKEWGEKAMVLAKAFSFETLYEKLMNTYNEALKQ